MVKKIEALMLEVLLIGLLNAIKLGFQMLNAKIFRTQSYNIYYKIKSYHICFL